MTAERAWLLRLLAALGAAGSVATFPGCSLAQSSCPESAEPNWQTRCFTKAELAGATTDAGEDAAGGSGGGGAVHDCPTVAEIGQSRLAGASVDSVADQGDSCCYRYFYPCEGRPLLYADDPVLADTVPRRDWLLADEDEDDGLDLDLAPETRAELAMAWARDAAFEHASIASFANFLVELLAFGAPLELVRGAERALADEVRHAELCYALASRYAGRRLGPGPLAVPPFAPRPLRVAALAALREGCIAETQAAYAARQRLALATEPAVQRVLERIVPDEERHAELAYRFLRWAIDRDPAILPEVERDFARACSFRARAPVMPDAGDGAILRAHGQLPPVERWQSSNAAIERIIKPCWHALSLRH